MASGRREISNNVRIKFAREYINRSGQKHSYIAQKAGMSTSSLSVFLSEGAKKISTVDTHLTNIALALGLKSLGEFDALLRSETTGAYFAEEQCLHMGNTETLWYPAIKTLESGFAGMGQDYKLKLDLDKSLQLDEELFDAVRQTVREKHAGKHIYQNGDVFHLDEDTRWWPPTEPDNRIELNATVLIHEYALFFTLTSTEHGRALLRKRISKWRPPTLIPELSGGLGINVAIVSNDRRFILGRRNSTQGPRKNQLDIGAVEGLSPKRDFEDRGLIAKSGCYIDIEYAAKRALREEYGINERRVSDLEILGFGNDLQYNQWNVLAIAFVDLNGEAIQRKNKYLARDGQEFLLTEAIEVTPEKVLGRLAQEDYQIWSCGIALAIGSMVYMFGDEETSDAMDGLDLRRSDQLI